MEKYNLSWKAFYHNFNARRIEEYNVLNDGFINGLMERLPKKKSDITYDIFKENLRSELMYRYWCKCEWEVVLSAFPPSKNGEEERKVDIYQQVMLNFEIFCKYAYVNLMGGNKK